MDTLQQPPSHTTFLDALKNQQNIQKVLLAGSGAVGKTSLLKCLISNKALDEMNEHDRTYHRTLFVDVETLSLNKLLGTTSKQGSLLLYDIAGQWDLPIHAIRDISRSVLGGVDVILLLFSNDNVQSLLDLQDWLGRMQKFYAKHDQAFPRVILVQNKTDLPSRADPSLIHTLRQAVGIKHFFEISCKTGYGLNQLRTELGKMIS